VNAPLPLLSTIKVENNAQYKPNELILYDSACLMGSWSGS